MIELNWENLKKLCNYASLLEDNKPYVGIYEEFIVFDGQIEQETVERFLASMKGEPPR